MQAISNSMHAVLAMSEVLHQSVHVAIEQARMFAPCCSISKLAHCLLILINTLGASC